MLTISPLLAGSGKVLKLALYTALRNIFPEIYDEYLLSLQILSRQ